MASAGLGLTVLGAIALFCAGCGEDERLIPPKQNSGDRCVASIADATDGKCLPPADARLELDGLAAPVSVLRDRYGTAHVFAHRFEDAFIAQGYLGASDRMPQLELLRRFANGRLAELFGKAEPSIIEQDALYRTIGLRRIAEQQFSALEPGGETARLLEAYAKGVNLWIAALRRGEVTLPPEAIGLKPEQIEDWSPIDSLAMGRLQEFLLSESLETELDADEITTGFRAVFRADSAEAGLRARAGILRDLMRFAPADPATTLDGFPNDAAHVLDGPAPFAISQKKSRAGALSPALRERARSAARVLRRSKDFLGLGNRAFGSNNWAVTGALSKSGRAMLASDPHLSLSSPAIFWPTHLSIENEDQPGDDLDVAGMEFPGIPGVILGFNPHLAWGATVAFFDVTDIYRESLTADGGSVVYGGKDIPLQTVTETLKSSDGLVYDDPIEIVPHHGPLLPAFGPDHRVLPPDPKAGALSVRWTGFEASDELGAMLKLWRARSVEDARTALRSWGPGAQNWMFADDSGNIFYTAQSKIPVRDPRALDWDAQKFEGTIPCLTLPGDGSAEWTGFLDEAFVPHVKNPSSGFVASANADQVGTTLDDDPTNDRLPNGAPGFLSCFYDLGFRLGRVQALLQKAAPGSLGLDDFARFQGDSRSPLGARLAPRLRTVLMLAEEERSAPGTHPTLATVVASARYQKANVSAIVDAFGRWESETDYAAESGLAAADAKPEADPKLANASFSTVLFDAWLTRLIGRVFLDEFSRVPVSNGTFDFKHGISDQIALRALLHLIESDPAELATYSKPLGDSILWDDLATATVETRDERMLTALLDALDDLESLLGADSQKWRWGMLHRVSFQPLVPLWFSMRIPQTGDAVFGAGFPRHGDQHGVDASNFDMTRALDEPLEFSYGSGPAQRFVIEMDPDGPRAKNALPGGAVWRKESRHFSDEAEVWRKNENHPVPFSAKDVIADSDSTLGGESLELAPASAAAKSP